MTSGQRLEHLSPRRRETLAAFRTYRFRMRELVRGATRVIVIPLGLQTRNGLDTAVLDALAS